MPFARSCGIEVHHASAPRVTGSVAWSDERGTAGVLHGGALMTLADSLGALGAWLNLPEGATTPTIVVQTDLSDDEGRPVAQVTQTQGRADLLLTQSSPGGPGRPRAGARHPADGGGSVRSVRRGARAGRPRPPRWRCGPRGGRRW